MVRCICQSVYKRVSPRMHMQAEVTVTYGYRMLSVALKLSSDSQKQVVWLVWLCKVNVLVIGSSWLEKSRGAERRRCCQTKNQQIIQVGLQLNELIFNIILKFDLTITENIPNDPLKKVYSSQASVLPEHAALWLRQCRRVAAVWAAHVMGGCPVHAECCHFTEFLFSVMLTSYLCM